MSNGPGRKTKHHRKPKSLGGRRTKENTSIVPRREHAAWHKLFDNYSAQFILEKLKVYLVIFSAVATEGELSGAGMISKQRLAWEILFRDKNIEEVLELINRVWLDPDFEFIITSSCALWCVRRLKKK